MVAYGLSLEVVFSKWWLNEPTQIIHAQGGLMTRAAVVIDIAVAS